jgi:hypothetical protein
MFPAHVETAVLQARGSFGMSDDDLSKYDLGPMGMKVGDAEKDAIHPVVAAYDRDGDGKVDMIAYDRDGDGKVDKIVIDEDGDGVANQVMLDRDFDGEMDFVGIDKDQDGDIDSVKIDTDGDGFFETTRHSAE